MGKVAPSLERLFALLENDFEPDLRAGTFGSFRSFGSFLSLPRRVSMSLLFIKIQNLWLIDYFPPPMLSLRLIFNTA